jgi:tetratricopeptide (TPR) repeat protein
MRQIAFIIFILLFSYNGYAQNKDYPYPSLSPKGTINQAVGNTTIEIEYERPSARKREVFGNLVPWNKVWRTGAGHCTKISFDNNVILGGQNIDAGKYSLFTIPDKKEWIVIINRDTTLYGSYNYDLKKDVARFVSIPKTTNRFYETLNFDVEIIPNNAEIFISWANTQISFEVKTSTDDDLNDFITKELLTKKNDDSNIYAGATEYLFFKGENLANALKLADIAIELDANNGWARSLKVKIYETLKMYDKALNELNSSIQNIKSRDFKNKTEKENELNQLEEDLKRIKKLKEN